MVYGTLICYTLSPAKLTPTEWNKFRKEFLGYLDHSNKGRYKYRRRGFMSEVPHVKLVRSVFIVGEKDAGRIMEFLKEKGAKVYTRKVVLTHKDLEKLQK